MLIFYLFGGLFLGLLTSLISYPIYPKEVKYAKEDLRIYNKFGGFIGACCKYEVAENKLIMFQKIYGEILLQGTIETENVEMKLVNNAIEYRYNVENYNPELQIEIKTDTLEKIEINK